MKDIPKPVWALLERLSIAKAKQSRIQQRQIDAAVIALKDHVAELAARRTFWSKGI
jgi:hypothetical protein